MELKAPMQLRFARLRSSGCIAFTAALLLAAAPTVRAADPSAETDQETSLREKANALMASSNWNEALPIWARLYALEGKPINLWNAAVCQYHLAQAGQATPNQALALLEQYRDCPDVPDEKKTKAQRYIDEMTALKEQRTAAVAPAPPAPPPTAPASPPVVTTSAPTGQEDPGHRLRVAAWTVGGVGAAALLAGIYFSVRTHSLEDKVTNEGTFSASDNNAGQFAETMQFVMYGVGAAALVTAGVLCHFGAGRGEVRSVALAPLAGAGRAGAVIELRF
jgi:hypothetical protein